MFLVDDILLAPFKGLMWVFEEIRDAADQDRGAEADAITLELQRLYTTLESGKITEAEFDLKEAELLDRLDQIQESGDLEDAENVFKKALTIPGYTEDSLAIFALQKIEKLKNDIEYGKAMDEGKKAISGEKWSEAEVAFKKALSLKGYESDLSALEGLKSAEKELELKKNRDAAKAAFEDASKKVITLLISIQNESKPTTERLNACDEALSLLDSTDKFCKIYLSSGDQSEISSLKSQIATLKSKLCPVLGNDWAIPDIGMEFVWIKALDCWVGKYEVTNGEYRKYKADHDSKDYFNGNRQPVVYVNYDNATEYAKWLTERERKAIPAGYIYRLPTEKEWTTFCQCGDNREYPWGNEWPPKYGNYGSMVGYYDDFFETCPVENSGKNDWGLYGVGGNVWECTIKSSSDLSFDAWRGASWCNDYPGDLRSAYHGVYSALDRGNVIGFRLVLSR